MVTGNAFPMETHRLREKHAASVQRFDCRKRDCPIQAKVYQVVGQANFLVWRGRKSCYDKLHHHLFCLGNQHPRKWIYNHNLQWRVKQSKKAFIIKKLWSTIYRMNDIDMFSVRSTDTIWKLPHTTGFALDFLPLLLWIRKTHKSVLESLVDLCTNLWYKPGHSTTMHSELIHQTFIRLPGS